MAKYREITASLSHTVPCGGHTPHWQQYDQHNGYPIGCASTAWAIVYAYWKAFKGKNNLFDGDDVETKCYARNSEDPKIKACMKDCARHCETKDIRWRGKKLGFTPPRKVPRGIRYAKNKGYNHSSAKRVRRGEFSKFSKVRNYLESDKPVILLIKSSGFGIPNHYVVIEEACKKQRKLWRKWRNRAVKYKVNYGQGRPSKWIYVREKGRNKHKVHSAGSVFLIDIR